MPMQRADCWLGIFGLTVARLASKHQTFVPLTLKVDFKSHTSLLSCQYIDFELLAGLPALRANIKLANGQARPVNGEL